MALIKCSECGKEISDKAESCPNCGAPNTPQLQLMTPSKKSSPLKRGCLIIAVSIFVLFFLIIVGGLMMEKSQKKNASTPTNTPKKVATQTKKQQPPKTEQVKSDPTKDNKKEIKKIEPNKPNPNLGINTEEFKKRYNQTLTGFGISGYRLKLIKIQDGQVNNTFTVTPHENVGIVGSIDKKTGKILSLSVISNDPARLVTLGGVLMAVVDPILTPDDRGKIFTPLLKTVVNNKDETASNITNDIKYVLMYIDAATLMFIVEKPERGDQ